MWLNALTLTNFRSYAQAEFEFGSEINLIHGANGSGKTTLLEAIHLLAMGRSFRTHSDTVMVKKGETFYRLTGAITRQHESVNLALAFQLPNQKKLMRNGVPENRLRNYLGQLLVVVLAPDDIPVIQGADAYRRSFTDRVLATTAPAYLEAIMGFRRVLKQRNTALKAAAQSARSDAALWDPKLAEYGALIWEQRRHFFAAMESAIPRHWEIFQTGKQLQLRYQSPEYTTPAAYRKHLTIRIDADLAAGRTLSGPQRDSIGFIMDGADVREFASLGEQKMIMAALKLFEAEYVEQNLDRKPLLLLDDLFATLDERRVELLMDSFHGNLQTLITTAAMDQVNLKPFAGKEITMYPLPLAEK